MLAGNLHRAVTAAFPKPVDWNKVQACTQKPDEPDRNYYNQLQTVSKEDSGPPLEAESTWEAFNYIY